ncbi:MAG: EAL domain-containing protein [Oscillospiraceae bacterium]|nr:EAL domain-containing protein [Oscillospiraceae bacterium]
MHIQPNVHDREVPFGDLFAQLVSEIAHIGGYNKHRIEEIVSEFCRRYRLCKGITYLYDNPQKEKAGIGEIQSCYDTGVEGIPVIQHRVVTNVMSTAVMTVYMAPDEIPLSDEEKQQCDLVMRTVLTFMSRNRLQGLAENLAFLDSGGYPNFRKYQNYVQNHPLGGKAALHYNLCHFTLVNQQIGRNAGDNAMRSHFRCVERIIGDTGIVCRLGGDNFVAVCGQEYLEQLLEFLTEAIVPYNDEGTSVALQSTAGVFRVPEDFVLYDVGQIMEPILSASRMAQSGKKERIVFFDQSLVKIKEKSMHIQQLFPEALKNREFRVYYQPKVSMETGELDGAEALCRWFHNEKMIMPGDFIPVLEQTTDICKLDFYMLEGVCMDLRRWLDEGREPVRVSVNLSRRHMMDADLLDSILRIIDRYKIPHKYLEIELTETTSDVEFRDLKRVVGGLQQTGIFTSVDDFGIGYSSLNLIRAIPWNVLKIDKSFVPLEEDTSDSTRSIMFGHVVHMAKQLGLECIAEGVETQRQVEILKQYHCDLAQGFFFDRPLPVEEFEKRLEQRCYSFTETTE